MCVGGPKKDIVKSDDVWQISSVGKKTTERGRRTGEVDEGKRERGIHLCKKRDGKEESRGEKYEVENCQDSGRCSKEI